MRNLECLDIKDLTIYQNLDGTINAFTQSPSTGQNIPYILRKPCCEKIGGTFDIFTQKCFYNTGKNCSDTNLKLIFNTKGNDGTIFINELDEVSTLEISFDYLFKFNCESLKDYIVNKDNYLCSSLPSIFENISASASIEKVVVTPSGLTRENVFTQIFFNAIGSNNLSTYLKN